MWRSNCSVVFCCVPESFESARALVFVVWHGFRAEPEFDPSQQAERIEKGPNYWRLTMADQPAKKQKTDVETLGISEMKALIKSAGLSSADCVEKSDLRARCREAQERLAEAERLRSAAAPAPAAPRRPAPPARRSSSGECSTTTFPTMLRR